MTNGPPVRLRRDLAIPAWNGRIGFPILRPWVLDTSSMPWLSHSWTCCSKHEQWCFANWTLGGDQRIPLGRNCTIYRTFLLWLTNGRGFCEPFPSVARAPVAVRRFDGVNGRALW